VGGWSLKSQLTYFPTGHFGADVYIMEIKWTLNQPATAHVAPRCRWDSESCTLTHADTCLPQWSAALICSLNALRIYYRTSNCLTLLSTCFLL